VSAIPTLLTVVGLAREARVNKSVVMRLAAEGKICPAAFLKFGGSHNALYAVDDITTVFDLCPPARNR
jgi:hypothetical protein